MIWGGTVHNARVCTFDGRDCWIAALEQDGRFPAALGNIMSIVHEAEDLEGAILWLRQRLQQLGQPSGEIRVRNEENRWEPVRFNVSC